MPNRRREAKFKYCQIPDGEDLLAVLGSAGIKTYGLDEVRRTVLPNHFHNLLEIGICRRGRGTVVFNNDRRFYTENSVIIIPANFPHNIINAEGEKSFWEFIYVDTMEFLEGDRREDAATMLINVSRGEQDIDDMTDEYRNRQMDRMRNGVCTAEVSVIYSEMLTDFERIGDHLLNIAQDFSKMYPAKKA